MHNGDNIVFCTYKGYPHQRTSHCNHIWNHTKAANCAFQAAFQWLPFLPFKVILGFPSTKLLTPQQPIRLQHEGCEYSSIKAHSSTTGFSSSPFSELNLPSSLLSPILFLAFEQLASKHDV